MEVDTYLEYQASHEPALKLLEALGYTYISPEDCLAQRGSHYHVLLKDVLRGQLRKLNRYGYGGVENEFSSSNIERAIKELDEPLTDGLVRTSEKIYDALLLGKSYPETVGEGKSLSFNLKYIDWEHPERNHFQVTKEFAVERMDTQKAVLNDKEKTARPDLVLFINGIPFGVIECKAPQVSVEQGVEQMVRNQQPDYIPQLFKFTQILLATNKNNVKYATTGTPKKFWSVWKEEDPAYREARLKSLVVGRETTEQDQAIVSLFSRERVMELMRYFVLFDANVKKICRYHQYFAVQEIMRTIQSGKGESQREGGVIWHTQGSGKSLTMVMLAKSILMEMSDCHPRVVIVTDRKELNRQITDTFAHTRLRPASAGTGRHLVELVKDQKADVITTIINKFTMAERLDAQDDSRDIFVLVDESHRSNYGQMSSQMRAVFPNACYIGFTGTPLMKKEKNTMARFGKLIHTYTIKDGVDDKAIVPLFYEGRFVDQKVDEANIDLWFKETTKRLTEEQQEDLRKRWSSIQRLSSTDARIRRIALDINQHFLEGYKNTGFKAMLATNYKRDAIRYLECFESMKELTCAVVISAPDMREGVEDADEGADDKVIRFWDKMMKQFGDENTYEETLKDRFCAGDIDILIVCSKLLTGFDAPICQVLYIDKELKEHGLLQAIARTNRLAEGKDYGMIVDYRGLIKELDSAMTMYSGAGLENFDSGDLQGVVVDVMSALGTLREAYTQLDEVFSGVRDRHDSEQLERWLEDTKRRHEFYDRLCDFGKALNVVLNCPKTYVALEREERETYKRAFVSYRKLQQAVKLRYCDSIDHAEYEPLMQNLLDTHLSVAGLEQLVEPVDIQNREAMEKELESLDTSTAKGDAIANRLNKSISEKYDENPAFYESFSQRIKTALLECREQAGEGAEYVTRMRSIMDDYREGKTTVSFPAAIRQNVNAQAFYGVLCAIFSETEGVCVEPDFAAEIAVKITDIVARHSQVDWTHNKTIHQRIAQDIDDLFFELEKGRGLKLSYDTVDRIIENVKTVAMRRF